MKFKAPPPRHDAQVSFTDQAKSRRGGACARLALLGCGSLVAVLVLLAVLGTLLKQSETARDDPPAKPELSPVKKSSEKPLRRKIDDLVGSWHYDPSDEQKRFASDMGKTAGPLVYTFRRNGTYQATGAPLSGRDYVESGRYVFDGSTLELHREGVGGKKAPVYERTGRYLINFEDDGEAFVGASNFGEWIFAGDSVKFRKR